jgi:hypothetical protein
MQLQVREKSDKFESMTRMWRRCALLFLSVWLSNASRAQQNAFLLFAQDTITDVTVMTDLRKLVKNKFSEEEQVAILKIARAPGDTAIYETEIRARGNVRKEVCFFPSTRIQFPKKQFTFNKLKWVNICDNPDDEEYLLKEYLAYKIYQVITDFSFGVRLIRVQYIDTEAKEKPMHTYAFVIEPVDALAARFGGRVYEPNVLKDTHLNSEQLAVFAFFQYLIGNTDWALGNRHNVEIITHPESNSLIPVAYDFDYSGLINASYAIPHSSLPIEHVTVRHNNCTCLTPEITEKTRQMFLEKERRIMETIDEFPLMKEKDRERMSHYLEGFFRIIQDEKDVQRIFVKDCLTAK